MSADGFSVRLERVFHGPLDLLLHLVREQEVEIHEVEIARVIEGYLEHLHALRDLDLEVAGDFLVMAATLMAIKSRSLLPREEVDLDDGLDPKDELIQRLIEYRRFREAGERLGEAWETRSRQHARAAGAEEQPVGPELDLGELSAWDLLSAFARLMRETLANRPHRIATDARPLRYYVTELVRLVRARGTLTLRELVLDLEAEPGRETLVGGFCALLELAKLGVLRVHQQGEADELRVELIAGQGVALEDLIAASVFDDELTDPPPAAADARGEATGDTCADATGETEAPEPDGPRAAFAG